MRSTSSVSIIVTAMATAIHTRVTTPLSNASINLVIGSGHAEENACLALLLDEAIDLRLQSRAPRQHRADVIAIEPSRQPLRQRVFGQAAHPLPQRPIDLLHLVHQLRRRGQGA